LRDGSGIDPGWHSLCIGGFVPAILPIASAVGAEIPAALIIPFGLLLALIAVMPLTPPRLKHLWEHYYPHVAIGLGLLVAAYYLGTMPVGGKVVAQTLGEYFSFISLIGSLFVVAGGIHLKVKGEATPGQNVLFLAIGAVAANLIGTTGASMVLIRPWIRMNKIRISAFHIVFFIFIVSNCGGALTPFGDPPLFLGYLRGVPFFWLLDHVVEEWLVTVAAILVIFYLFDRRSFGRAPPAVREKIREHDTWRFEGGLNVLFLLVIIGAVFLPETCFLREFVMLGAAVASHRLTPRVVHDENQFTFGPIREVALLFAGIFLTMMPALGYLDQHGREFGFNRPAQYYFASGGLSSVLDNAPTYLNFLELAEATFVDRTALPADARGAIDPRAGVRQMIADPVALRFIIAVSLGSVFFGAMTYIGNGPNFMVKSIAESSGVKVPTFFGYLLKYSLPILLPILALGGWLFL
jgi:Na+/H+ antiporter NhaD/arsenite permease-like protein